MRQHLYYLKHPDIGPLRHAQKRGFTSVFGLKDHLEGLVAFAGQVDQAFASESARLRDDAARLALFPMCTTPADARCGP